ncbi:aberrant root formation protein 4 isoform X2 [Coffea eugenioides]|uniref:aberrant root formation protein 4 isoform X2 n=1 Tax=Coffea eugenioides TaxID=49369 RepID=UPI000F611177|nr:aberrant root formation protein 4 isoform X2 [Coffea eugenioides]
MDPETTDLPTPCTSSAAVVNRLRQSLSSCSQLIQTGVDFRKSEQSLSDLVLFLNSISDSFVREPENQDLENASFQILTEIRLFITSSSVDQAVIDALSFELPKTAARFACVSPRCMEFAQSIVDCFTDKCSPRDMLSILCEAIGSPRDAFTVPSYFAPLLSGFPKVFVSIRKRQFEQVKAAVPVILNALKAIVLDSDDEDADLGDIFHKANCIADSMKAVCLELEGKDNEKLCALLGLFVLQITALASMGIEYRLAHSSPLVLKLSHFLQCCGLSYLGLIMGTDVEKLLGIAVGDGGDDLEGCFSDIWLGASILVIWGYKSNEVALAAGADLVALKDELQSSRIKRWHAVGMLKHVLLCLYLPLELKKDAINFLLSIMHAKLSQMPNDENEDYSTYMPTLCSALQAIQVVIMYATDVILRKNAFAAFKELLADCPTSLRFDILRALIKDGDSSSMIAVLLDCVREEVRLESTKSPPASKVSKAESEGSQGTIFWSSSALELVELVLRPPGGGPPSLPEHSDAVLSALNLYRFILIKESTGKSNNTGVLSRDSLVKAHSEWLLPLRTLVTRMMAEAQCGCDELALCGLNPVEVVLYRCIELVEELT